VNRCAKAIALIFNLGLLFITVIFIGVQAAPGPNWTSFPTECDSPLHCTRITSNGNVRAVNISTPQIPTLKQSVIDTSTNWIYSQSAFIILQQTPDGGYFIHSKFISNFFAFPDDFGLYFFCNNATQTEVWIQSQSRIGVGDLNVNDERSIAYVQYLASISFTPKTCS